MCLACFGFIGGRYDNGYILVREKQNERPCASLIGFVHSKDLLAAPAKGETPARRELVWKVITVPELMAISDLLKLMQKNWRQIVKVD